MSNGNPAFSQGPHNACFQKSDEGSQFRRQSSRKTNSKNDARKPQKIFSWKQHDSREKLDKQHPEFFSNSS